VSSPIVVAVETSRPTQDPVALGAALAAPTAAPVVLAAVYPHQRYPTRATVVTDAYERDLRESAAAALAEIAAELDVPGGVQTRVIGAASPARGLQALAEELDPAVLVLGSTHRGRIGRVLVGGTAEHLLHGAPCAVAVAKRGAAAEDVGVRRIGVGYVDTADGREAVRGAVALARGIGTILRLITVDEPMPYTSAAIAPAYSSPELARIVREDRLADLERAASEIHGGIAVEQVLLDGPAAPALTEASADLDLLVCGSRGYGAVGSALLGSVSRHLVNSAACPVLVVPRGGAAALERLVEATGAEVAG